jgi:hypothetical protein
MRIVLCSDAVDSSDVVLVGEYTTSDGPDTDDYFLLVITKDRRLYEVPSPGDGPDCAIGLLRRALGVDLTFELYNRTDFSSRVMFPLELKGRPIFRCVGDINAEGRKGIISRWWNPSLFLWEVDATTVDEAIRLKQVRDGSEGAQPVATANPDSAG